jgi:hypothetical protein
VILGTVLITDIAAGGGILLALLGLIAAFGFIKAYGRSSASEATIKQWQANSDAYREQNVILTAQVDAHEKTILAQGQTIIDQAHDLAFARTMIESRDAVEALAEQTKDLGEGVCMKLDEILEAVKTR